MTTRNETEVIFEHPIGLGMLRIVKQNHYGEWRYDITAVGIRPVDKPELVLIIAGYI